MNLQDSVYSEDVEYDVTIFVKSKMRKRVLIFPPVNDYRRYIIHQLVQDRYPDLLRTFSIGYGSTRRTVVCYKSDLTRDQELTFNVPEWKGDPARSNRIHDMGVESQRSPSTSPERKQLQRQAAKSTVEIYRPPAARKASDLSQPSSGTQTQSTTDSCSSIRHVRQRRPDRAVYVPRHRRSLETEEKGSQSRKTCTSHATLNNVDDTSTNNNSKLHSTVTVQCCGTENMDGGSDLEMSHGSKTETTAPSQARSQVVVLKAIVCSSFEEILETHNVERTRELLEKSRGNVSISPAAEKETLTVDGDNKDVTLTETSSGLSRLSDRVHSANDSLTWMETSPRSTAMEEDRFSSPARHLERNDARDSEDEQTVERNVMSNVPIMSDAVEEKPKRAERAAPVPGGPREPPERKAKKIERQKSKPATPPSPPLKINRDECDWDSLFDDNGDCLDPTLIEELTSAVGEVTIEQPKNNYKAYSKQIEVSSDEFAHVVEIYNFPSEFKTSDLAAAFSTFKTGGFELKWVDDTHCLGVFSSPLVAAEVLASDHPFVKTRPLSEATASSKVKARKSAEFLQPYRNRPETCAALARRLVTGALGVKLATARQEREREKDILREAKEKRRLANKQQEDVWEDGFSEENLQQIIQMIQYD